MYFAITQEIDLKAVPKSSVIDKVSNLIQSFLSDKSYGDEIQNLYIGCICMEQKPGYEQFFKIRKPRYKPIQKVKLPDDSTKELRGIFSYDIKLDFDTFIESTDEKAQIILGTAILDSLTYFDALPKKIKKFDANQFKKDLESFLLKEELVE